DGGARGAPAAAGADEQPAAGAEGAAGREAGAASEADGEQQDAVVAVAEAKEEREAPGGGDADAATAAEPVLGTPREALVGAPEASAPARGAKSMPPTTAGSASAPSLLGGTRPGTVDTGAGARVDPLASWRTGEWKALQELQATREDVGVQTRIGFDQPLRSWAVWEVDADPPTGANMVEATRRELLQWCLRYIERAD
ncbi:unnamed protein product, partial [Prorocentrum cordatum]